MLDVLVEVFRILLAVLGILVVASMIIGLIMVPFENAKKKKEDAKTQAGLMCLQMNTTIDDKNALSFDSDEFYYKSTKNTIFLPNNTILL